MKWPLATIDSIRARSRYSLVGGPFGSDLTTRDYVDDGIPVIRGCNLPDNREFLDEGFVFVREKKADALVANTAYPGDVLFTQRGTLGQVGVIPPEPSFPRYVILQSQMKLTVALDKADPRFVYYFFRHPDTAQKIKNHGLTSGVPHINLGILKAFELPLPPLEKQRHIVSTLSGYDDLIENNRRRMALLEESARLLYREWFVHLHFPGHEHTRIVDGVREGWERRTLESVCVNGDGIQTGPFGSQLHQSDYSDNGLPLVMPKDLVGFRISTASIARIPHDLADKLGRHRMAPGDTVYGRRGDIGRRAYIGRRQSGWFCGTGCLRLRPDQAFINPVYLFDTLADPETAGVIVNRAKGSTMPNLSASALKTVPVLLAPRKLQDRYAEQIQDRREMVEILEGQSQRLRTARDLLRPRLMSGEIAI